jgi:hypothetical protein
MNLTSRAGRRLAAGIALASSAILLPAAALAASAAAGSPGHPAAAVLPMAGTQRGIRVLPGLRGISCHLHPLAKSHLMDADVTGDLSNRTATVEDESYRLLLVLRRKCAACRTHLPLSRRIGQLSRVSTEAGTVHNNWLGAHFYMCKSCTDWDLRFSGSGLI